MASGLTLSTTSSLSDMSSIVVANAIQNVEPAGPSAGLVNRITLSKGEKQVNLPIWGRMTAAPLTEGVDLASPQQLAVTVRTITTSEHGLLTFVSNRLARQNNEQVLAETGTMQGRAIGRLRESDIVTLYNGFSKSVPGSTTDATMDDILGAISYIETDNNTDFGPAPSDDINGVFHAEQIRRFVKELVGMQAGGSGMPAQPIPSGLSASVIDRNVIASHFRGREPAFGVNIWHSGVIARDSSLDAKGAIFHRLALYLAMSLEVDANDEEDVSMRGTEVVTVAEWGEGEAVDPWGVEIYSAASAIT